MPELYEATAADSSLGGRLPLMCAIHEILNDHGVLGEMRFKG
jgi:hypothetical protein